MNLLESVSHRVSRRVMLSGAVAACVGTAASAGTRRRVAVETCPEDSPEPRHHAPPEDYRVQHGRIKQSAYSWCFEPMPAEQLIRACHRMGLPAMDVEEKDFPLLKQLGMKPTMIGSHGFVIGPLSRKNHPFCIEKLRRGIDLAVHWGSPHVITFTGMREKGVSDEEAARNCVDCWKQVIGYAEKKGINLCLEILNTRDASHPMKGHPGYFGNDVERCIDLIKQVGSPRMKLLFDVYHVQVMNGDVIRRIRQYKEYIGHYHIAGVPGRNEPDETQEINYPAVMRAILATGYAGYLSQEFIPTWPDKLAALRYAVRLCDVAG
jgi:hydroxypyruvate isomerase